MGWEIVLTDLTRGDQQTRTFSQTVVRVGRNPDNELVLKHNQVSRLHFALRKDGEAFSLEESSSNGTFLKSADGWTRLQGKTPLVIPCTLRVAEWSLRVDYVPEVEQDWDQSVIIPAGTLSKKTEAVMVFDLCGSSKIANENDHLAFHLKTRVSQIADPVLLECGQRFNKNTGDGFMATFPSAGNALTAAIEIEKRLQLRNSRTTNEPIHYRMSLHYGEVWGIGNDVHGNDVNIAFRIEGVQKEAFATSKTDFPVQDRLMCSSAFLLEVMRNSAVPGGVTPLEVGPATLKGIQEQVRIYWLKTLA